MSHSGSELARALTNSGNRKQRRGERAARGCGTGAGLAGRPRRGRNGETNGDGSPSKDYGKAKGRGVNQRAGESVELDNLAPQVGFEPTTLRLTNNDPHRKPRFRKL